MFQLFGGCNCGQFSPVLVPVRPAGPELSGVGSWGVSARPPEEELIDRHVAYVYEDVCRAQLWDLSAQGIVPVFLEKVGRWWDAKDGEIDIVGLSEADNAIVFGECKFKRTPVGVDVLTNLEEKSRRVKWGDPNRQEYFVLFSISGFSDALHQVADQRSNVILTE